MAGQEVTETTINDFRIIKQIGKGSYGFVHRVRRLKDGLDYAMKEIDISSMELRERDEALNEIRLLASIRHPSIIRYCDTFFNKDNLCIVTEFGSEGDLLKKIRERKDIGRSFDEEQIWAWFVQLLVGLEFLHTQNIMHRDMKPQNVMLTMENGRSRIKIGDLGIAKLMKHNTFNKTIVGTPYYLSPEIWSGKGYEMKSDVWAVGCLLYELVTLRPPFEAKNMQQLSDKIRRGQFHRIPAQYSRDLTTVLQRMLVPDPARRASIREILGMKVVRQWANRVGEKVEEDGQVDMINTIRAPGNVRWLKHVLPEPQYPGNTPAKHRESPGLPAERATRNSRAHSEPVKLPDISKVGGGERSVASGYPPRSESHPPKPPRDPRRNERDRDRDGGRRGRDAVDASYQEHRSHAGRSHHRSNHGRDHRDRDRTRDDGRSHDRHSKDRHSRSKHSEHHRGRDKRDESHHRRDRDRDRRGDRESSHHRDRDRERRDRDRDRGSHHHRDHRDRQPQSYREHREREALPSIHHRSSR